jgi:hypothetical protein
VRRIERFADGSTLTRLRLSDGAQAVSIRDATGRVLWRERILPDGTSIELVNDLTPVEPVEPSLLPAPGIRELRLSDRTNPDLARALLHEIEADARALGRNFSLRQIREIRELRDLLPALGTDPVVFGVGNARFPAGEGARLAQVGLLMERLVASDPRELFLVEGYTDATGRAAFNLALADRRAQSVALALTELFDIPPENLIVQGYGENHLRIPTPAAEDRNRRVTIRRITPLLGR